MFRVYVDLVDGEVCFNCNYVIVVYNSCYIRVLFYKVVYGFNFCGMVVLVVNNVNVVDFVCI